MREKAMLLTLVTAAAAACGPGVSAKDDGSGGHNPDAGQIVGGGTGSVSGTVWAPGNAPGLVMAGQEIPVAGAIVYLASSEPDPIPTTVYCDQCKDLPVGAVQTDARGAFSITDVTAGTYWLVIEKGQFRLDQQVTVGDGALGLTALQTTLPSQNDPAHGKFIPRIALAYGYYDQLGDILAKMGLAQIDGSTEGLDPATIGTTFDVWNNSSADELSAYKKGELGDLVSNIATMRQYHIIFVPCSDTYQMDGLFANPQWRANIMEYVSEGGKFYVTDWSAEWEDSVFPAFIQFASDHDTPPGATTFNDGDGFPGYQSDHAKAADADLSAWLSGQTGPRAEDDYAPDVGPFNGDDFAIYGNWDHIVDLPNELIGYDASNMAVYEQAKIWVSGDEDDGYGSSDGIQHPLTVTFEPTGCGRVLYSTYHTADTAHLGLMPQERILLYLIMEIGTCKSGPIIG